MKRHRHGSGQNRHRHKNPEAPDRRAIAIAALLALLSLWATIPYGSAATWAQALVCIPIAAAVLLTTLIAPERVGNPVLPARLAWLAALLLGWGLFQLLPLPTRLVDLLTPFDGGLYTSLPHGRFTSLAFDRYVSLNALSRYACYALLTWVVSSLFRNHRDLKPLAYAIIILGAFQSLYAILAYNPAFGSDNPFLQSRLVGTFSSGNSLGGFLALTVPVTTAMLMYGMAGLLDRTRGSRLRMMMSNAENGYLLFVLMAVALSLAIQVVALADSGSRGATVAMVLALLSLVPPAAAFILRQKHPGKLLLVAGVALGLVLLATGVGRWMVTSRMEKAVSDVATGDISRLRIWGSALALLAAHPWGVGLGGFPVACTRFQPAGFAERTVTHAHNDYFELLSELGIPGFVILVWLGYGLFRVARQRSAHLSPGARGRLLQQGFAAATLAGLVHAFVDFNLTSRPGVAILFLICLAATLARLIDSRRKKSGRDPATVVAAVPRFVLDGLGDPDPTTDATPLMDRTMPERKPRSGQGHDRAVDANRRLQLLGTMLLLLAPLSMHAWHVARMDTAGELAFAAAGGTTSLHFWRDPAGNDDTLTAETRLTQAAETHDPTMLYRTGAGWYVLHDQHIISRFRQAAESAPANGLAMEQLLSMTRLGLRIEEAEALKKAQLQTEQSLARSPWHNRAHAVAADILGRQAPLAATREEAETLAVASLRGLQTCVSLAGRAAESLTVCCNILATLLEKELLPAGKREQAMHLLAQWGLVTLNQEVLDTKPILAAWHRAGLAIEDMPEATQEIPLAVLEDRYIQCRKQFQHDKTHQLLTMLERQGVDGDRTAPRGRIDTRTERARLHLRMGRWQAYRDMAATRDQALADRLQRDMAGLDEKAGSDDTRYLWMTRRALETGFDPATLTRYLDVAARLGRTTRVEQELLSLALRPSGQRPARLPDDLLSRLAHHGSIAHLAWVALASDADGEHLNASHKITELLKHDDLPYRLRHRVRLLAEHCATETLMGDEARQHLVKALDDCDSDPDLLRRLVAAGEGSRLLPGHKSTRVVDALAALQPPYALGTRFLGGQVELAGFDLQQPDGPLPRLRLFWRFWGPVPTSLQTLVRFRNQRGASQMTRSALFSAMAPIIFGAGQPVQGATLVQEIPINLAGRESDVLVIGLRSDDVSWIRTTGLLSAVELTDWRRWIRTSTLVPGGRRPMLSWQTDGVVPNQAAVVIDRLRAVCPTLDVAATNHTTALQLVLRVNKPDPNSGMESAMLGPDGYVLRTAGQRCDVLANTLDGLSYGAAAWIQEALGAACLLPDPLFSSRGPGTGRLAPPALRIEQPAHKSRLLGRGSAPGPTHRADQGWAAATGLSLGQQPAAGHGLQQVYPPETFFASHPEWYPLIGEKRSRPAGQDWQPCFSTPAMTRQMMAYTVDYFEEHPDHDEVSLSINDSTNWCECAGCRDLIPPPQRHDQANLSSWSEPYWSAVQAASAALARQHPEKRIIALAYGNVEAPPTFALNPNITALVCQDAAAYFDESYCDRDLARLKAWSRSGATIGRCGYAGLPSWVFPRYSRDELERDIRNTAALGMATVQHEGNWLPWVDGPLPWITARMLWNPALDAKQLQLTFCRQAFGPAAAQMNEYFDYLQEVWSGANAGRWLDGRYRLGDQARRYPPDVRQRMQLLLTNARRHIREDTIYLSRIDAVYAPLSLSFALAAEADIVRKYEHAARNGQAPQLEWHQALREAHTQRVQRFRASQQQPWFPAYSRQVTHKDTLGRWDRKLETLLAE